MAALPPVDLAQSVEDRIAAAVPLIRASALSLNQAAKRYGIAKTSLHRAVDRAQKGLPLSGTVGRPLALGGAVEIAIVQFFVDCASANLPQITGNLKEIAIAVANGMGVKNFEAGKKWRQSFLERHGEEMDRRSPRPFPIQRERALTMEAAVEWMRFVKEYVFLKYFGTTAVDPRRLFNMDESPFKMGLEALGEKITVLATKHGEDPRVILGEFKDTFTGITFVGADGSRPLDAFITRGSTLNSRVFRAGKKFADRTKTAFAATEKVSTAQD